MNSMGAEVVTGIKFHSNFDGAFVAAFVPRSFTSTSKELNYGE